MRSEIARTLRGAAGLLLLCLPALAEETRRETRQVDPPEGNAGKKSGVEVRYGHGLPPDPGPTSGFGPAELSEPAVALPGQAQAEEGPLHEATLVGVEGDVARVRLPEGELLLKPGDTLGNEIVKSVHGRQIVLRRPAQPGHPGGDALVVAEFDATGQARVRVIWSMNPGSPIPPEVQ